MGALPSKKPQNDMECFAPINGRYTRLDEEVLPRCNTGAIKQVRAADDSNVGDSPLRKRLKLYATESLTKNSPCKTLLELQNYRHLTLPMIVRQRPSYRKALGEPIYIPTVVRKKTISENQIIETKIPKEDMMVQVPSQTIQEQKHIHGNLNEDLKQCDTEENLKISKVSINTKMRELKTAYKQKERMNFIRKKKICRRYSKRQTPYEKFNLPQNENLKKQNTVCNQNIKQLPNNDEREINIEKLMTDLRTAYELKKNSTIQDDEIIYREEKTTFKINKRPSKRRAPYERMKPKSTPEISSTSEPGQQQEKKSLLQMEVENKLYKLRKTKSEELLEIEIPRTIKPYFVSCIPPAQAVMKEALLMELKQYFAKGSQELLHN